MAQNTTAPPTITPVLRGIGTTSYVSWFFEKFGPKAQLPTPDEVIAIAASTSKYTGTGWMYRPPPVRLSNLGILVKWGNYVTQAEAACLLTLKIALKNRVPVPELYGWHEQPADPQRGLPELVFIFMEEIIGETLDERFRSLQHDEEAAIARQLAEMIAHLRTLQPCSSKPYIGKIS